VLEDLTAGEAQLNRLLDKRADAAAAEAARWSREAPYRAAEREAERLHRQALREEWFSFHLSQADRIEATARSLANKHRAAAKRLGEGAKAAGDPIGGSSADNVIEFRKQHQEKTKEEK